jgi:CRISPR-associated protein Cmr6
VGRFGDAITFDAGQLRHAAGKAFGAGANPLILLRRVAVLAVDATGRPALDPKAKLALLEWAEHTSLGQDPDLVRAVDARRRRAATALARQAPPHAPLRALRLVVRPMWRIAVGLGNRLNPWELGLSLHGTYGWPVIPGSSIKGAVAAWARQAGHADDDPATYERIFGLPRAGHRPTAGEPGGDGPRARRGSVTFLDASPHDGPIQVRRDVVTPHVQPYYRDTGRKPPAEYHQPIPSEFLTVDGGAFGIDLIGPPGDTDTAAQWCRCAVDDLGVGAKTAAGYGYLIAGPTMELA